MSAFFAPAPPPPLLPPLLLLVLLTVTGIETALDPGDAILLPLLLVLEVQPLPLLLQFLSGAEEL